MIATTLQRTILSLLLAFVAVAFVMASGLAFKDCTTKQTADFSTGFSVAAGGVSTGITEVHALRVSGVVEPQTSLKLAHEALDVNSGLREAVGGMLDVKELDDAGRLNLVNLLDRLIPRAQTLADDGTLHLKNGKTKVVFALAAAGGVDGLRRMQRSLKADIGKGLKIPITDDTAAELKATADTCADNETRLRAVIAELGG